jgi:ABC-type uncharacterized transport system substrate-binding protein
LRAVDLGIPEDRYRGKRGDNLLVAPLTAEAQPAAKGPRVGWLSDGLRGGAGSHLHEAFLHGLRDLGYVKGQNIVVERRDVEGKLERLPDLAAELVRLKVDVIVTMGVPGISAAKRMTGSIPIVMADAGDPVGTGLVASLARPGGNLTGLSISLGEDFSGKWLELLKEAVPKISRVAVLGNPANPANTAYLTVLRSVAQKLGVKLQSEEVRDPGGFDRAFASMSAGHAQALVVVIDPLTVRYRGRIAELAAKNRLPAMYGFREFVDAGGLMAYGVNVADLCRRAATYVDKILKGAKPAELPVEQPTKFELVINMKTAKGLGLTIPQTILLQADRVIE